MKSAPDTVPESEPEVTAEVSRLVDEARTLWERRELAASEPPLRRALELAEASLGTEHRLVAVVLSHLGWLAAARETYDEAVSDYRRALAIREAGLGSSHPETLRAVEELAAALFQADAYDEEADALALRAIAAHDESGRDDPDFAALIAALGWRRYWTGRYADAEPMLLRALDMRERLLGPGHAATADTAQRLGTMYDHRGFDVDPEPFYRKAMTGFEAAHGADHPCSFEARCRLADYLDRQGRDDEAGPLLDGLVESLQSRAPWITPEGVHWMLGVCCDHLRAAGRDDEAEAIEAWAATGDTLVSGTREEVARAEANFGPESPELAEALGSLASFSASAGRADEAEEAARRAHAILKARLGPDDPATTEAAGRLANIRGYAEHCAANRPRPKRLGRPRPKLFDGTPWRDERRPDLIRVYLSAAEDEEQDLDDPTGALAAVVSLSFSAEPDEQWDVILELIARAPDDEKVLQNLAAGPLEGFLGRFDEQVIDRVEAEAGRDPKFRRVLSGVWKHGMSDPVRERVRAIQATEPNPLPEMRPFTPGSSTLPEAE